MKRGIQKYSQEYVEWSRRLTPTQRMQFVDDFMKLAAAKPVGPSKLISLKISPELLKAFRRRCELEGIAYQTQIKKLMQAWLLNSDGGESS